MDSPVCDGHANQRLVVEDAMDPVRLHVQTTGYVRRVEQPVARLWGKTAGLTLGPW